MCRPGRHTACACYLVPTGPSCGLSSTWRSRQRGRPTAGRRSVFISVASGTASAFTPSFGRWRPWAGWRAWRHYLWSPPGHCRERSNITVASGQSLSITQPYLDAESTATHHLRGEPEAHAHRVDSRATNSPCRCVPVLAKTAFSWFLAVSRAIPNCSAASCGEYPAAMIAASFASDCDRPNTARAAGLRHALTVQVGQEKERAGTKKRGTRCGGYWQSTDKERPFCAARDHNRSLGKRVCLWGRPQLMISLSSADFARWSRTTRRRFLTRRSSSNIRAAAALTSSTEPVRSSASVGCLTKFSALVIPDSTAPPTAFDRVAASVSLSAMQASALLSYSSKAPSLGVRCSDKPQSTDPAQKPRPPTI